MIRPELIQLLRKEAEEQAKQILGKTKRLGKHDLSAKESITKKFQSGKHAYLKQSQIDYCINNGIDIWYLYDELLSKYGGLEDKPKKVYYVKTGKKRGRPKKDNNEQEQ